MDAIKESVIQELTDQAQELDMGYGKNGCPTCGKSQQECRPIYFYRRPGVNFWTETRGQDPRIEHQKYSNEKYFEYRTLYEVPPAAQKDSKDAAPKTDFGRAYKALQLMRNPHKSSVHAHTWDMAIADALRAVHAAEVEAAIQKEKEGK